MIRVHAQQMEEVGRALALEQFEDEMVVHLRDFSPWHMEVLGEAWTRRAIRLGIERAAAYGVTNPGLLRFHVELMVAYGSAFDVDPLYPWAGEILRDATLPDEVTRMDRLFQAYREYRAVVSDPFEALKNLIQLFREDAPRVDLETLSRIYPQRSAYLGEQRLLALVRRGQEEAARHDLATDRGIAVVIGILFAMGSGFAADPLYPWIAATLRDPEQRAERLQRRTRIYLERAMAYLERKRADGDV